MNLKGFSNRDKSIINKNPDKNPYELKELGLSNAGFERLLTGDSTYKNEDEEDIEDDVLAVKNEPKKVEVKTTTIKAKQPEIEPENVIGKGDNFVVTVEPITLDMQNKVARHNINAQVAAANTKRIPTSFIKSTTSDVVAVRVRNKATGKELLNKMSLTAAKRLNPNLYEIIY